MRRATMPVACVLSALLGGGLVAAMGMGERTAPEPGRFQIVMSTITARDTFKIDTATGDTWVLVDMDYGGFKNQAWQGLPQYGVKSAIRDRERELADQYLDGLIDSATTNPARK